MAGDTACVLPAESVMVTATLARLLALSSSKLTVICEMPVARCSGAPPLDRHWSVGDAAGATCVCQTSHFQSLHEAPPALVFSLHR